MYSPSIWFTVSASWPHQRQHTLPDGGGIAPYVLVVFLIPQCHHFVLKVFQISFDVFDIAG